MPVRFGRQAEQARPEPRARRFSQLGRGARRPGYRAADWACVVICGTALTVAIAAAITTPAGYHAALAVQRFLLFYAGVFALVALTVSVGSGLAAADRVFLSPGARIAAQAAHRAASFAAVVFLGVHIATEVLAGRSGPAGAVIPSFGPGRAFYLGLGAVAADLLVLIVVTGLLRGRFARVWPAWLWRALHAVAYACWPIAILHGLLAGRTAKPYVDWSYGACVAAVAFALVFRAAAGPRAGATAAAQSVRPAAGMPAPYTAAPLPGAAGAGLPAPGLTYLPAPTFPYPPAPGFQQPSGPGLPQPTVPGFPHVPAAGAGARRALPAPGGTVQGAAATPAPGQPQPPGPGYRGGSYPGPGYHGPGYYGPGYHGPGYPTAHYSSASYPGTARPAGTEPGWPRHGEAAQSSRPGHGGR